VAADEDGNVVTTTSPLRGGWRPAVRVDRYASLTGISCPTTTLCVAVDSIGNVTFSTRPTAGASAWARPTRIDTTAAPGGGYAGLTGVSCPTATLCVAVDGATKGAVDVTTDPAGGAKTWKTTPIATGPLTSIACASATLCVAAGDQHYVSTSPVGGVTAWKGTGTQVGAGVFSAISCPALTLCVGVGYGNSSIGLATGTATPKGDASAWKTVDVAAVPPVPGQGLLDAIGCPTITLCVAVDTLDNAYISAAPAAGTWSAAAAIRPGSASDANAISCTATFCVVVDSAGVQTTGVVS
jgi:hypothetical protein